MRSLGSSGVWELFVPGIATGELYKFEVSTPTAARPQGRSARLRDAAAAETASRVWKTGAIAWGDDEWMAERAAPTTPRAPIAIYEVHLGSWRRLPDGGGG